MNDFQHGEITEKIIGAAFEVHGVLGYGFLEKVYETRCWRSCANVA